MYKPIVRQALGFKEYFIFIQFIFITFTRYVHANMIYIVTKYINLLLNKRGKRCSAKP